MVTVIIPTFNRAKLLRRALDSVFAQKTTVRMEVIVVDDGSTDDTQRMLSHHFPQVSVIKQENQGVSAARNAGINAARGNWIALLDSDDVWQPNKIRRQLEALKTAPEYLVCHTDEIWIRHGIRVNYMKKHKKRGGHIFRHCLPRCIISPSSVLIHCQIFYELGLFDESLPVCEDYDLWLRLCTRYPVLYLHETLMTKYGGHVDQLSRRVWGLDRFRIFALEKIIKEPTLSEELRQEAIGTAIEKIRIYLNGAGKRNNMRHTAHFIRLLEEYTTSYGEFAVQNES